MRGEASLPFTGRGQTAQRSGWGRAKFQGRQTVGCPSLAVFPTRASLRSALPPRKGEGGKLKPPDQPQAELVAAGVDAGPEVAVAGVDVGRFGGPVATEAQADRG